MRRRMPVDRTAAGARPRRPRRQILLPLTEHGVADRQLASRRAVLQSGMIRVVLTRRPFAQWGAAVGLGLIGAAAAAPDQEMDEA
jgi:hypothetical protein